MKMMIALGLLFGTAMTLTTAQIASGLISPTEAKNLLAADAKIVLLDVRTPSEYAAGHIPRSKLLPYDEITAETAGKAIPTKDATVIVYCRSGRRSAIAAAELKKLGYARVLDLGGINSWPYEVVK